MSGVGDSINASNASWTFDGNVANTFESHIEKSVPSYREGHQLILDYSDFFVKNNSNVYELGCSTGLLINQLAKKHGPPKGLFYGLDCSDDMISFAKKNYASPNLIFETADVLEYSYLPSDLMITYYLLQFISPSVRQNIVNVIYENLNWGGAFICFEKTRAPDARFQDISVHMYNEFKLSRGFTNDEILSKSRSLKGILEPFSTQGNIDMFKRAGFTDIMPIFKYICFEGFLCIK